MEDGDQRIELALHPLMLQRMPIGHGVWARIDRPHDELSFKLSSTKKPILWILDGHTLCVHLRCLKTYNNWRLARLDRLLGREPVRWLYVRSLLGVAPNRSMEAHNGPSDMQ